METQRSEIAAELAKWESRASPPQPTNPSSPGTQRGVAAVEVLVERKRRGPG